MSESRDYTLPPEAARARLLEIVPEALVPATAAAMGARAKRDPHFPQGRIRSGKGFPGAGKRMWSLEELDEWAWAQLPPGHLREQHVSGAIDDMLYVLTGILEMPGDFDYKKDPWQIIDRLRAVLSGEVELANDDLPF